MRLRLTQRSVFIVTALLVSLFFLYYHRVSLYKRADRISYHIPLVSRIGIWEDDPPGFFKWATNSSFDPVRIDGAYSANLSELCASFPTHLLDKVQPVLKTGHGVLDDRVIPQLHGVSACMNNLLIFSDMEEEFEDHHIYDAISTIPRAITENVTETSDQLQPWRDLNNAAKNGTLDSFVPSHPRDGWRIDKFKFMGGVSLAWKMRPEREWYFFYEADTYVFWDNAFRLLSKLDPDTPLYFGSPTGGRSIKDKLTWFANGGPGFVVSRGAMRKLVADDYDPDTGDFLGSVLSQKEWYWITHDCCGDSLLGWALARRGVFLRGLYPMFTPHAPHGVPFMERHWCQPIVTMHKPHEEEVTELWRWEWTRREHDNPLLYRDLAQYYNFTSLGRREDWDSGGADTFKAPRNDDNQKFLPNESADACEAGCMDHPECFQWRYHLRECLFTRIFRYGKAREPGALKKGTDQEKQAAAAKWEPQDLRFISGWNGKKIQRWMDNHPCEEPHWVKPSVKRIF